MVGGVVLGGVLGNTIARDIDCDDQPVAFQVYATGLNGEVGRRYEWRHGNTYGYFTPTREFRRRVPPVRISRPAEMVCAWLW